MSGRRRRPLTVLIAVIAAQPWASGQARLPAVVLVRADLEDDRVAAPGDGAPQRLLQDRREREVDVMARRIQLDRRDLARLRSLVHRLDQLLDLVGAEAANGHDPVEVGRPVEVLVEIAVDADVRPAEGVEPAAVDAVECAAVHAEHLRELARAPVLAEREVALARLQADRPGRHRAEALEGYPLGDRRQAVQDQAALGRTVTEQAGRGEEAVPQPDPIEVDGGHGPSMPGGSARSRDWPVAGGRTSLVTGACPLRADQRGGAAGPLRADRRG